MIINEKEVTWKMFLRTNGKCSLFHLADENNDCVCGWSYKEHEYTKIYTESWPDSFLCCSGCLKNEIPKNNYMRVGKF
jgi:hypothetical protein